MVPLHQFSRKPASSTHQDILHDDCAFVEDLADNCSNDVKNDYLEMDAELTEADSSLSAQRFNWQLVGIYATEQEMLIELLKQRVNCYIYIVYRFC